MAIASGIETVTPVTAILGSITKWLVLIMPMMIFDRWSRDKCEVAYKVIAANVYQREAYCLQRTLLAMTYIKGQNKVILCEE